MIDVVTVDGIPWTYHHIPPQGGKRPALVFLHGLGEDGGMWEPTFRRLQTQGRIIAPHLLSRGKDPGLKGFGQVKKAMEPEAMVRSVEGFLETLGVEERILVGCSWGGLLALLMASQKPEKTRGLVIVGGAGVSGLVKGWRPWFNRPAYTLGDWALRYYMKRPEALRRRLNHFLFPGYSLGDQEFARYYERFASLEARKAMLGALLSLCGPYRGLEQKARLIQSPVLVVWGEGDLLFPASKGRALARGFKRGKFRLIKDCGHVPPLEKPDQWTNILQEYLRPLEADE